MANIKKILFLLIVFGLTATSSCDKNTYKNDDLSYTNLCEEDCIITIYVELVMENYTSEHNLTEDEIEKQRRAISELQKEFIKSLKGKNVTDLSTGMLRPWLAMDVDIETLIFICRSPMVEEVQNITGIIYEPQL